MVRLRSRVMASAGLGISTVLDPEAAADEACRLALTRLGASKAAVALVVASAAHGASLSRVAERASQLLGAGVVVGGSVEGIVAPGVEVSSYPAVMALAISGVEAVPFLVRDLDGDAERAGEEIRARVGEELTPEDLVVAMPDSLGLNASKLATGLAHHLCPATILGAGTAPIPRGSCVLWCGAEISHEGVAGFVARGVRSRLAIAQAGRSVTPLLTVTRARGNWVLALDGRPGLDVYQDAARAVGLDSVGEGPPPLLVGLSDSRRGETGALLVRNVVGVDRKRGGFSIPEPMASGQRLAFVRLDPASARACFAEQLEGLQDPLPGFGLYFNCRARGASLFGEAGVEATYLANAFADRPVAGLSGPFQLAPPRPGEEPVVLTYAGALALVDGAR